jgi:hypothetical protein
VKKTRIEEREEEKGTKRGKEKEKMENLLNLKLLEEKNKRQIMDLILKLFLEKK